MHRREFLTGTAAVAIAATHDPVPGTLAAGTGWGTTSFHGFHF